MQLKFKVLVGHKAGTVITLTPDPSLHVFQSLGFIEPIPEPKPQLTFEATWVVTRSTSTGELSVVGSCVCGQKKLFGKPTQESRFSHCAGIEAIPAQVLTEYRKGLIHQNARAAGGVTRQLLETR